mmetsp:Transcript_34176/g.110405  ORF Transcript_34176/g.110405 Transcript_34176/m.110405 type:complete len:226 (+) Transcript_34176:3288-3965(+)
MASVRRGDAYHWRRAVPSGPPLGTAAPRGPYAGSFLAFGRRGWHPRLFFLDPADGRCHPFPRCDAASSAQRAAPPLDEPAAVSGGEHWPRRLGWIRRGLLGRGLHARWGMRVLGACGRLRLSMFRTGRPGGARGVRERAAARADAARPQHGRRSASGPPGGGRRVGGSRAARSTGQRLRPGAGGEPGRAHPRGRQLIKGCASMGAADATLMPHASRIPLAHLVPA